MLSYWSSSPPCLKKLWGYIFGTMDQCMSSMLMAWSGLCAPCLEPDVLKEALIICFKWHKTKLLLLIPISILTFHNLQCMTREKHLWRLGYRQWCWWYMLYLADCWSWNRRFSVRSSWSPILPGLSNSPSFANIGSRSLPSGLIELGSSSLLVMKFLGTEKKVQHDQRLRFLFN